MNKIMNKLKVTTVSTAMSTAMSAALATLLLGANAFALIDETPYLTNPAPARPNVSPLQQRVTSYNIKFYAWGNRKVVFRDEAGRPLGDVRDGDFLQINVPPQIHNESITPNGISVPTLLSQVPMISTPTGGKVLPVLLSQPMRMSNGRVFPAGSRVYADLSDFYVSRTLQPSSSSDGDPLKSREFVETLATKGVTRETRPTAPPLSHMDGPVPLDPDVQTRGEEALDPHAGHNHGEGSEVSSEEYERIEPLESMPTKFLTAPLCECKRKGGCGIRKDQSFGAARGKRRVHAGQDMFTGRGTPIVAAAYGCVASLGVRGGYGRIITLKHGNGLTTSYAHLSKFAKGAMEGRCYERGEIIGYSGDTGSKGQPHLHFEVRVNGVAKNPRKFMIETSNEAYNRKSCQRAASLVQERHSAIDSLIAANVNPRAYARATSRDSGTVQ